MSTKKYKPTTPSRRDITSLSYGETTTDKPGKSLLQPLKSKGGRNNNGRITARHQGGGHERAYRMADSKRDKDGIPARVVTIEYDPNCSANIALLDYVDGEKRYIIAPKGLTIGTNIISGEGADIKVGSVMELKGIPEGTFIHDVKLRPGKGEQLVRSAGASTQILGIEEKYTTVRLASGEVRKTLPNCRVTIGQADNEDHGLVSHGRAGRTRRKGIRPIVRGPVMNPDDHPHGGGEGCTLVGRKFPTVPWGKEAMGVKTCKARKASTEPIVRRHNGK